MELEPDDPQETEDPPECHFKNDNAEGLPPVHSSEDVFPIHSSEEISSIHSSEEISSNHSLTGESSAPLFAEGLSNNKRKIEGNEEKTDTLEGPPIEEKKIRISVRKFFPEPPAPPEELKTPETLEIADSSYRHWPVGVSSVAANYYPELYQDHQYYDINQPSTSGLGGYHKIPPPPLQDYSEEYSAEVTALRDMEIVRAFLSLILEKGNSFPDTYEGISSFIKEITRIIDVNIDGLCLTDEMRKKMKSFCNSLILLCDLSQKHLESFQGFEPFVLQYAQILNNVLQENQIKNYDDKIELRQKILDGVHSCKEHLDELTNRVTRSIVNDNHIRSKTLRGKDKILSDGTKAVVINLDASSDDEETPSVPPEGVEVFMNNLEDVLPLEAIPKFIDLLTEKDTKSEEELPLTLDLTETLIFKTPIEISCLNLSENLLVIGCTTGKIMYINLLNNELIEEKNQDHNSAITSIEIWKNYIVTSSDQCIRCLNLVKNFSRTLVLKDLVTAMSIYGGLLHIGTNNGFFFKLSLPYLNFIDEPSRVCDSPIISLNVIKGTQSAVVLLGTPRNLFLWNTIDEMVMNKFDIMNPRKLCITPELVLNVSDTNIMKASTIEIHSKPNWLLYSNPFSEGASGCILNGEEENILIGCRNGDFAHFDKLVVASNGTSVFYVSTVNPMIKKEPVDNAEDE